MSDVPNAPTGGNHLKPLDYKYVSGLPYVPHELWNYLKIAPQRAWLERHLGIVQELLVMLPPGSNVRVHPGADNALQVAFVEHHLQAVLAKEGSVAVLYSFVPLTAAQVATHGARFVLMPDEAHAALPRFQKFKIDNNCYTDAPTFALHVALDEAAAFRTYFALELKGSVLTYDNLVNLCIMVKNGGALFEKMLRENLPYVDRWTIMDTGSTDETLDIIQRVLVGTKRGTLYHEPFENFRESRNRCLDLAGKSCKYNVMLDDTYVIRGDIRRFLEEARGDEFSSSFSLYVTSDDVEYTSNRITRSDLNLRYIFKIHEVIQKEDNVNVVIPKSLAYVDDMRAPYMEERTMDRKRLDLKWLHESLEEEPHETRHLYYLAQTYNLLKDYENAEKYFRLRAYSPNPGFVQEQADANFELARVMQFQFKKPWHEVEPEYLRVLQLEPRRVDAMYFLGIYHIYDGRNDEDRAYAWFEKAFPLGYPTDTQYSLKPTLVYYYLSSFLAPMCYKRGAYALGMAACERFETSLEMPACKPIIQEEVVARVRSWHAVYKHLMLIPQPLPAFRARVEVAFIVDGNWTKWTGADIETRGLGGSETWAVEMATQLKKWLPEGRVVLFCKCDESVTYKGVEYLPLTQVESFMAAHQVSVCLVSRFSEYVPLAIQTQADEVYFVLHDVGSIGEMVYNEPRLRAIMGLSPWHADKLCQDYPQLAPKIKSLGYGIDAETKYTPGTKKPHSFAFSSFPNRGLRELLAMWPRLKAKLPDATLDVFCDLNHPFVRSVSADYMADVDKLLLNSRGVTVRGWVTKQELAATYGRTEYWLYPCVFEETFCLTALEAVACGAIGIAPPLAALQHMPLYIVNGNAASSEWANAAIEAVMHCEVDARRKERLIENGLRFAWERSWERQALLFISQTALFPATALVPAVPRSRLYTSRTVDRYIHTKACGKLFSMLTKLGGTVGREFVYAPNLLQSAPTPWTSMDEWVKTSASGLVETPSPLAEVLRGVDPSYSMIPTLRGFGTHQWIIWYVHTTHTVHYLPKAAVLQHIQITPEQERRWATLLTTMPILRSAYIPFDSATPAKLRTVIHDVTTTPYFESMENAIAESIESTRALFPHAFMSSFLDGERSSLISQLSLEEHLRKLSASRRAGITKRSATRDMLEGMRDRGFYPRVIYDIGACVLEWTAAARAVWPEARIIVFDAMRSLEWLYKEQKMEYYIGVLSNEDGRTVRFFQNEMLPFGNSYYREKPSDKNEGVFSEETSVVMQTHRLDTVFTNLDIPPPDLVKIDVQGSEGDVIAGGGRSLQYAERLIVELQDTEFNLGAPTSATVIAQLQELGFTCTAPKQVDSTNGRTADYVFTNTRKLRRA